jgi:uncharacterized protein with LGFP repeats
MSMDEPEQVRTERVVASVSSPMLQGRHDEAPEPASTGSLEFEVPWVGGGAEAGWHPWLDVGVGMAIGIVATVASGDARIGLAVVGVVALARFLRSADRLVPFSFGEGFVGYRADLGWPQGVQEDDGVRWSWRPARRAGSVAAPPARPISGR